MKKEKSDQNAVAELTREGLYKENKWLWEENKKLKEKLSEITMVADDEKQSIEHILELEEENKKLKSDLSECECSMHFENDEVGYRKRECKKLKEENKKLKEDVEFYYKSAKQFREDGESWRKEAELLLGIKIMGKTLSERIDEDKKVIRMDTSCMEEDTLQELKDLGEI